MLTNGAGCLPCRVWPPSVTRAGAVYTVSVSVSVPRLHVSMSPWARPVYGGGLYLYGHDSGSPLIKISNADCLWVLVLLYN